ncbi:MAG: MutS2/Smr-associated SH3 domain-containing protein [Phycisphaerae bacterium]
MDSFTLNKIEFGEIRRILAEFCACSLGKELARHISPSRNPEVIRKWLSQVTQMVKAHKDKGLPPFGGVTDITAALERARPGGGASGQDYVAIAGALEGAGNIKKYLDSLGEELDALREMSAGITDFSGEIAAVWSIVAADGRVKDEASMRLAEVRRQMEQTSRHIHDVVSGFVRDPDVAKLLQSTVVMLHGDRYVLPLKAENRGRLSGVVHRESNTGSTVFVEPQQCVELNNLLADLAQDERNEVQRLLNQLAIRISARAEEIAATMRVLSQVDLISAKAQYSYQFEMTCPEVGERGPVVFTQARHPLLIDQARRQERAGVRPEDRHPVVPIDVRLGQDFDLLVITGSNTGGKTVTLKTVATLVLMAQSGMHIPAARGATMPAFHDVYIDVGDEQSLQQSLSTFGAHIKRIRYILHKATAHSLVLLDELGSGTDPDEGGAIGQAVLDELRAIGCLGMATTHLSVLKAYAFGNERVDNASVEFDTATLSPTYKLLIGTPGESHAIVVAQKLGLPKRMIAAARNHLSAQGKQFRKAIAATTAVRKSAEAARADALAAQSEARSQSEVYQAKLADLHRLQAEFETWLARLGELKTGDEVFVPSLKKTGHLVRLELHRQIALVDVDNLQIEVPLPELMPDLGQNQVREQIAALRQQIMDQARATEEARAQAQHIQEEYHRSLVQQKERARQFDNWLGAIARVKAGDEVPISQRPGRGKITKVDLQGLRATVLIDEGGGKEPRELELPLSELFPQTGPFAHLPQYQPPAPPRQRPPQAEAVGAGYGHDRGQGRPQGRYPQRGQERVPQGGRDRRDQRERGPQGKVGGQAHGQAQRPPQAHRPPREPIPDGPMHRGKADGKAAEALREQLLKIEPGQQVFVVPFNKRATLIRMNADKGVATVQSGIFEMEVPLADLEPIRVRPPAEPEERPARHKEADKPPSTEPAVQQAAKEPETPAAEMPPTQASDETAAPPAEPQTPSQAEQAPLPAPPEPPPMPPPPPPA